MSVEEQYTRKAIEKGILDPNHYGCVLIDIDEKKAHRDEVIKNFETMNLDWGFGIDPKRVAILKFDDKGTPILITHKAD